MYTNFAQIYYYFYWVSMPTATTLVFCAGNVALTIGAELRQIQVRSGGPARLIARVGGEKLEAPLASSSP